MAPNGLLLQALTATLALALGACANDFAPQSRVDTLRVIAVRPEPASGAPGQSSSLDLALADGASGVDAAGGVARPLQVVWLAGCHNPPARQFFGCYPLLGALAKRLSSRAVDTPATSLPASVFGTGPHYDLLVPTDILSGSPKQAGDVIHFGVSFAFFAVCAGELHPRPDLTDRVPLECLDAKSGAPLGRRDFVTGYTTLYSYEGVTNHNPELRGVHFGALALTSTPCTSDADCAGLVDAARGFGARCGARGTCDPVVPACSAAAECPKILITPDVGAESAEALPGEDANEVVWANYYSTAGSFEEATELVNDHSTGYIADHGSYFRPATGSALPTTVWVTINDQRGGAAFRAFEVWSR